MDPKVAKDMEFHNCNLIYPAVENCFYNTPLRDVINVRVTPARYEGLAGIRLKVRPFFEFYYPSIFKAIHDTDVRIKDHPALKELAEICVYVAAGIHDEYKVDCCSNPRSMRRIEESQPLKSPPSSQLTTFERFPDLPPELRCVVWDHFMHTEDRIVVADHLRKITRAPCPVILLVCQESKSWAEKLHKYKKVMNGNLLRGRVLPMTIPLKAPLVSFETDIFYIGKWQTWITRWTSNINLDVQRRLQHGIPLTALQRGIQAFSGRGVRRVAIPGDHSQWADLLYFANARAWVNEFGVFNQQRQPNDWAWAWCRKLEEVYTIGATFSAVEMPPRRHMSRVFPTPSTESCACSLCHGENNTRIRSGHQKPAVNDRDEHERLFALIHPGRSSFPSVFHRDDISPREPWPFY
ncbi:hypothetical protein F4804DRAFT_335989 [Jackrogersella minutella]|nr:hypothetical protein F4804DRAFT_335989 [Jackrogersella minutella]